MSPLQLGYRRGKYFCLAQRRNSAEFLLMKILKRAKQLVREGNVLFTTEAMKYFLFNEVKAKDLENDDVLHQFSLLDDYDVFVCIKQWIYSKDSVLAELSDMLVNRRLLKVRVRNEPFSEDELKFYSEKIKQKMSLSDEEVAYFVFQDSMANNAYDPLKDKINILHKNGKLSDITEASDNFNIQSLSSQVKKHFMFFPEIKD